VENNANGTYCYRIYGLTLQSWIPFPELEAAVPGAPVDVVFRRGEVPEELPLFHQSSKLYQSAPDRLLVRYKVGRFLVNDGKEIVVQPSEPVSEADLRLFFLCSPMGATLLQRGVLPLHASAISTSRGAVLFMGESGAGKSTLAAEFRSRGYRVMADDISVVRFSEDGLPWVSAGFPQFKLRPDAVEELGEDPGSLPRLHPDFDKHTMPFPSEFHSEPMPLACVYVIQPQAGASLSIQSVPPLQRVSQYIEHTYRLKFIKGLGLQQLHFQQVTRLAEKALLRRVVRPDDRSLLATLADSLEEDFNH